MACMQLPGFLQIESLQSTQGGFLWARSASVSGADVDGILNSSGVTAAHKYIELITIYWECT